VSCIVASDVYGAVGEFGHKYACQENNVIMFEVLPDGDLPFDPLVLASHSIRDGLKEDTPCLVRH
jgi:hypothetical protein